MSKVHNNIHDETLRGGLISAKQLNKQDAKFDNSARNSHIHMEMGNKVEVYFSGIAEGWLDLLKARERGC